MMVCIENMSEYDIRNVGRMFTAYDVSWQYTTTYNTTQQDRTNYNNIHCNIQNKYYTAINNNIQPYTPILSTCT